MQLRSLLAASVALSVACAIAVPCGADVQAGGTERGDTVGLPGVTTQSLQAAKALLKYNGTQDALLAGVSVGRDEMVDSVMKLDKLALPQARLAVDSFIIPEMDRRINELLDLDAEIVASKFSAAELEQLAAFYQTSLGKKLLDVKTDMYRQMSVSHNVWRKKVMADAWAKFLRAHASAGSPD